MLTRTRRQFCATLGAAGAAGLWALVGSALAGDPAARTLRVIAYNVYACQGWPENRPSARQVVAKGQMARRLAMELALYDPDIINFSESPSDAITQEIAGYLGMNSVRFPSGGNWPGTLISRYEITQSQNVPLGSERPPELFTRHWGRATIQLPGGESLIVHSAHLYPVADPKVRLQEIKAMLKSMQDDLVAGRSMLLR